MHAVYHHFFLSNNNYTDIASHHSSLWVDKPVAEFGVFTVGELKHTMNKDLLTAVKKTSKPGQLHFKQHKIIL